ncbi:MAG: hypothetical protein IKI84_13335 [Clostridia bacterium]|nr:hypothetical protein [Clostridia bacterium]
MNGKPVTDFYKELDLDRNKDVSGILEELKQREQTWLRREIRQPEEAQRKLALIREAGDIFVSEDSRQRYDRELLYEDGPEEHGDLHAVSEFEKWIRRAEEYLENEDYSLCETAIGNARKHIRTEEEEAGTEHLDAVRNIRYAQALLRERSYGSGNELTSLIRSARNAINRAIALRPNRLEYYRTFATACDLAAMACGESGGMPLTKEHYCREKRKTLARAAEAGKGSGSPDLIALYLILASSYVDDIPADIDAAEKYAKEAIRLGDRSGKGERIIEKCDQPRETTREELYAYISKEDHDCEEEIRQLTAQILDKYKDSLGEDSGWNLKNTREVSRTSDQYNQDTTYSVDFWYYLDAKGRFVFIRRSCHEREYGAPDHYFCQSEEETDESIIGQSKTSPSFQEFMSEFDFYAYFGYDLQNEKKHYHTDSTWYLLKESTWHLQHIPSGEHIDFVIRRLYRHKGEGLRKALEKILSGKGKIIDIPTKAREAKLQKEREEKKRREKEERLRQQKEREEKKRQEEEERLRKQKEQEEKQRKFITEEREAFVRNRVLFQAASMKESPYKIAFTLAFPNSSAYFMTVEARADYSRGRKIPITKYGAEGAWTDVFFVHGQLYAIANGKVWIPRGNAEEAMSSLKIPCSGIRKIRVSDDFGRKYQVTLFLDGVLYINDRKYSEGPGREYVDFSMPPEYPHHVAALRRDGTVRSWFLKDGRDADYGECDTKDWRGIRKVLCVEKGTYGLTDDGRVLYTGKTDKNSVVTAWTHLVDLAGSSSLKIVGLTDQGKLLVSYGLSDSIKAWENIIAVAAAEDWVVGLRPDGTVIIYDGRYLQDRQIRFVKEDMLHQAGDHLAVPDVHSRMIDLDYISKEKEEKKRQEEEERLRQQKEREENKRREEEERLRQQKEREENKRREEEERLRQQKEREEKKQREEEERLRKKKEQEEGQRRFIAGEREALARNGVLFQAAMMDEPPNEIAFTLAFPDLAAYVMTVGRYSDYSTGRKIPITGYAAEGAWTDVFCVRSRLYAVVDGRVRMLRGHKEEAMHFLRIPCGSIRKIRVSGSQGEYQVTLSLDGVLYVNDRKYSEGPGREYVDFSMPPEHPHHVAALRRDGTVRSWFLDDGHEDYGECDTDDWRGIRKVLCVENGTYGLTDEGRVLYTGKTDKKCDAAAWTHLVDLAGSSSYQIIGLTDGGKPLVTYGFSSSIKAWENIIAVAAAGDWVVGLRPDGTVIINDSRHLRDRQVRFAEEDMLHHAGDHFPVPDGLSRMLDLSYISEEKEEEKQRQEKEKEEKRRQEEDKKQRQEDLYHLKIPDAGAVTQGGHCSREDLVVKRQKMGICIFCGSSQVSKSLLSGYKCSMCGQRWKWKR